MLTFIFCLSTSTGPAAATEDDGKHYGKHLRAERELRPEGVALGTGAEIYPGPYKFSLFSHGDGRNTLRQNYITFFRRSFSIANCSNSNYFPVRGNKSLK